MTLLAAPVYLWLALAADQVAPDADVSDEPSAPVARAEAPSPSPPTVDKVPDRPRLATLAFATAHEPQAPRTRKWTQPREVAESVWSKENALPFSRFLGLAHAPSPPAKRRLSVDREWTRDLVRFTHDMIADLTAALGEACPPGRCAPTLDQARRRLESFVGASVSTVAYQDLSEERGESEIWNGWRLSGGSAEIEVGCAERIGMVEVECRLTLGLDGDVVLSYKPGAALVDREPAIGLACRGEGRSDLVGEIRFGRTYSGTPVVLVGGTALAEQADVESGRQRQSRRSGKVPTVAR